MSAEEKFYKVFVSSTYEDLQPERNEVFDSLLKCGCFPVGMEHFPGSNSRSLDLIKKYIDQCDYYLIVSAGKYGSLVPNEKISYTEWEYNYATERNIPCLTFLHQNLDNLIGSKLDKQHRKQLDAFRGRLTKAGREVKFYETADELGKKVLHAFQSESQHSPAIGWVRARREAMPQSNELIGMWKLKSSSNETWNRSDVMKIYTANEFLWLRIEPHSGRTVQLISGCYQTDSYFSQIFEIPRVTSPQMKILGAEQQFHVLELNAERLKTVGVLSTGVEVEEEFERVNWS